MTPNLGQLSVRTTSNGGKYCILINGSTDSSITITKASWTSATAASVTQNDRNTSIAIEGALTLSEPKGIIFLDNIVKCCIALGIDSANAVWCLKTFFVGYKVDADGSENIEHITYINPLMFLAIDVAGSFSEQGGIYEITFVALSHGAARLPQFSKSGYAANFQVGNNLREAFKNFTEVVTDNYNHYYDCITEQIKSLPNSSELVSALRYVNYVIEPIAPYDQDIYTVTNQLPQAKSIGDCNASATGRLEPNASIESGIHYIMSMCDQYQLESSEGVDGIKYEYKIHTTLESKPIKDSESELAYTVYYRVKRHVIPHSLSFESFTKGTEISDELKENVIEFDYLYTGHNIDILDFDMKLALGLVYLQSATTINSYNSAFNSATVATYASEHDIKQGVTSRLGSISKNIPVYFGTLLKNSTNRNNSDAGIAIQSAYNISKHSSLELTEASMRIIGNPLLISNVNKNTSPDSVVNSTTNRAKSTDDVFPGWGTIPSFAKVHIKMPRNNDDIALFTGSQTNSDNNDYAIDFWFQGFYYIIGIEHVFDNGEFTQTLQMLGIPEKSALVTDNENADQTKSINKKIVDCYNNTITCQRSEGRAPYALPEHRPTISDVLDESINSLTSVYDNLPTNLLPGSTNMTIDSILHKNTLTNDDANLFNKLAADAQDFSNIRGWDNATDAVKDAILKAAAKEQVDPFILAQLACHETGAKFNTEASAKSSTAKGLFQFINSTWKQYGKDDNGVVGDVNDPYQNAIAGARYMKRNQKILRDGLGREPTAGETYLAHNQDGPRALGMILGTRSPYHPELQGYGLTKNTTAKEMVNWAENVMTKTLKKKVDHIPHKVSTTSTTQTVVDKQKPTRTNKIAVGATKDCDAEQEITKDQTKFGCTKEPINNQDEKQKS